MAIHVGAFIAITRMTIAPDHERESSDPIVVQWLDPAPAELARAQSATLPAKMLPAIARRTPATASQSATAPAEPVATQAPGASSSVVHDGPAEAIVSTPAASSSATAAPVTAPAEAPPNATPPDFSARYLQNPPPAYPGMSRRLGESGRVTLRVLVGTEGSAQRVELRTSSGSSRLDGAALDTVRRWRFVPARQGDVPVEAWVLVPIVFTLES